MTDGTRSGANKASPSIDQSLALLLADGVRFTGPLTQFQRDDLLLGLLLIARGDVQSDEEQLVFDRMLHHQWVTTAPFAP